MATLFIILVTLLIAALFVYVAWVRVPTRACVVEINYRITPQAQGAVAGLGVFVITVMLFAVTCGFLMDFAKG